MSDHKELKIILRFWTVDEIYTRNDLVGFVFWKDYPGSSLEGGLWETENPKYLETRPDFPPVLRETIGVLKNSQNEKRG